MKKVLALLSVLVVCASVAFAQDATKAAAAESTTMVVGSSVSTTPVITPFVTVVKTSITPPGGKDMFITFSAQSGVFTFSANADTSTVHTTSTAENVTIQVRVLVDGVPLPINPKAPAITIVTLDNLIRGTSLTSPDPLTLAQVVDEAGARSFTWVASDVSAGTHTVEVQSRFNFSNPRFPLANTSSSVSAVLGARTLTVEQVQLKD